MERKEIKSIIDDYVGLLDYAEQWGKINSDKLKKKAAKGKFDMALIKFKVKALAVRTSQTILEQCIKELNAVLDKQLTMSNKEKEETIRMFLVTIHRHGKKNK